MSDLVIAALSLPLLCLLSVDVDTPKKLTYDLRRSTLLHMRQVVRSLSLYLLKHFGGARGEGEKDKGILVAELSGKSLSTRMLSAEFVNVLVVLF